MRIYLAPCGMGLGHITRCKAIVNISGKHDWPVYVSTYSDGLEYARGLGYPIVETVPVELKTNSDGRIDFKLTAATSPGFFRGLWSIVKQIVAEIRNIQRLKPAIVVSDSRASPLIAARFLNVPSIAILNQFSIKIVRRPSKTKLGPLEKIFFLVANMVWFFVNPIIGWFWSFADKILIPDLPIPYTISSENLAIPKSCLHKVEFIGPLLEQAPLPQSRSAAKEKLGYDVNRPLILVPLSTPLNEGLDYASRVESILEKLPHQYQVVMSRGKVSNSNHLRRKDNITVYDWILNLDEHLQACDLVVCRAGHLSILGSLAYGRPMLILPIEDHPEQLGNARRAYELGVAEVLGTEQLMVEHLLSTINNILNSSKYAENASKVAELILEMKGTERVIATIQQLWQRRVVN